MKLSYLALLASLLNQQLTRGFTPVSGVAPRTTQAARQHSVSLSASSSVEQSKSQSQSQSKFGTASDAFLSDFFRSECDDFNVPPSLSILLRSISQLASGSDIRGRYVEHSSIASNMASTAQAVSRSPLPALTPFAAHCLGFAFATMLKQYYPVDEEVVICIGRDPRPHGSALADAFARGAEGVKDTRVVYTGVASTPALFEFCRYVSKM